MGLILDSSFVIAAERRGRSIRDALEQLRSAYRDEDLGISVVTVAELTHGVHRAGETYRKQRRQSFIDHLCADVPVYPMTLEIARVAGQLGGQQAALGNVLPFADLVIGVTALSLGYRVLTANARHFQRIPNLQVLTH